jgi:CRISPR-associated protein Csm3
MEELEVTDENGNIQRQRWQDINTDLPYTEVKWEAVIDVLTAAATPRQMERVPAGALFDVEMLFSVYDNHDKECLRTLLLGMRLLEDDYLGSSGSRGYGKVAFRNLTLCWKSVEHYKNPETLKPVELNGAWATPEELLRHFDVIAKKVWNSSVEIHSEE